MQTVFQLRGISQAAQEWIDENVQREPYQMMGPYICVEHRYIGAIVAGMFEAGLLPCKDFEVR